MPPKVRAPTAPRLALIVRTRSPCHPGPTSWRLHKMSQNFPSEKDPMLALALAGGQSITAVADQFGLDRRTIYARLADPAFRQLVAEFRGQLIATALGILAEIMTRAARAVAALLDSQHEHIRLRAARTLFSTG